MTEEQFWAKIDVLEDDECWEWMWYKTMQGYGHVGWEGSKARAHRVAWELTNGSIPPGLLVCHTCDNPPCCNPSHLFLGTHKDNTQDAIRKCRQNNEEQRRKISEALKGNQHALGYHHIGKIPWNVGKHNSEETKYKMAVSQKRRRAREALVGDA